MSECVALVETDLAVLDDETIPVLSAQDIFAISKATSSASLTRFRLRSAVGTAASAAELAGFDAFSDIVSSCRVRVA
eukprot:CAMPEP_0113697190 /NCGR_PEP_ID=MMETSP0038_2-20120614/21990_1 /TAXON_ID=2898 /ORGANISM="Cryptomonas paramecium" /LENGTH=76 /DNA_ID=CAMNT_0000620161 /DNA_START=113 /DNA_END=340 /DNA_ORIENTATION=+ /assembly_acc=CAM_ASM_000170